MSMSDLPPGRAADIDQGLAGADAELDTLVTLLENLAQSVGEDQGLADLTAYIARKHSPATLAMLTALAIRRISRAEATA